MESKSGMKGDEQEMDKEFEEMRLRRLALMDWLEANNNPKVPDVDKDFLAYCIVRLIPGRFDVTSLSARMGEDTLPLSVDELLTLMEVAYFVGFRREKL